MQPQQSQTVSLANNNPWAALDPLDSASPSTNGNGITSNAFALSGFNPSSAEAVPTSTASITSSGDSATTEMATTATPTRKRTPADFLGDHKDLVDLEKLVDRNPGNLRAAIPFKSINRVSHVLLNRPSFRNLFDSRFV